MQLEGKRAIITGGANGIAEATVRAFVREGASVVSLGIQDEAGKAVAESATEAGPGTALYLHCDVSDQAEVDRVFADAVGHLDMAAYGAAKGAVEAWTRNVATEWARHGVRVNTVGPAVWTPLARRIVDDLPAEDRTRFTDYFAHNVPLGGDLGEVTEPANVTVFLASDNARFMTGQMVQVDGGQVFAR
jgi:NAD(P)-dependent dehydrogenase (short-subunit alcohol dehydrogenase family)